jgi:hypothetical protein
MLAAGGTTARLMNELRAVDGNLTLTPKYRFAAVTTDNPGPWVDFGATNSANGVAVDDYTMLTPSTSLWIQLGLSKQSTSVGQALLDLQGSVVGNAVVVGARTLKLPAGDVISSATAYYEVGAPFPTVGLTKLMFGYVFSGVGGISLVGGAAGRLIKGDTKDPNAWAAVIGGSFSITANTSTQLLNSGELTPASTAGHLLAQAGIYITGPNPQAEISVLVAAIYG